MGRERVGQLLHLFQARLSALRANIASEGLDWRLQRAGAHQRQGSASSLGLMALATSLGRLEAAIDRTLADVDGLEAPDGAIASALTDLSGLQARAEAAAARCLSHLADNHTGDGAGALNL